MRYLCGDDSSDLRNRRWRGCDGRTIFSSIPMTGEEGMLMDGSWGVFHHGSRV